MQMLTKVQANNVAVVCVVLTAISIIASILIVSNKVAGCT